MPKNQEEDLFLPAPKINSKQRHVYTVSQLTQDIKIILENTFAEVWVEGEVSGVKRIATGTVFFSLKDETSLLKCVIFASYAKAIKFELKDGIKVICFGRVSVYEGRGEYQLYAEEMEPKGIGSLQLALEQLKMKLEKEGLFDPAHKRQIPRLPSRIGVVTSLEGAAIKDILKVLERRFKNAQIIINAVRVQGEGAKEEIARGIRDFNLLNKQLPAGERMEVMIVGRGGGSIEDLWAFNEEIVARAIYDSQIPVISAVGHERDWTISDLVADLRAATPSVAAELVLPEKVELSAKINDLKEALKKSFSAMLSDLQETTDEFAHRLALSMEHILELAFIQHRAAGKKLALLNPALLLAQYRVKVFDLARQIFVRADHFLKLRQARFLRAAEKLSTLSPLNVLSRGYSITFKLPEGQVIKDIKELKAGDTLKTKLYRGEVLSEVTEVSKNGGN